MKKVWIDNYCFTKGGLVDSVCEFIGKDDFNVELFGVSFYDDELPTSGFFQIVDYGSRGMIHDGMN